MPITYKIDRKADLISTTCSGDVTVAEVLDHFETLSRDPDRPDRPDVFLDLRPMTSSPSADEIRQASDVIASLPDTVRFRACAVVAHGDLLYGMSRMFSVFAEQFFTAISAFRSAAEAGAWLQAQRAELPASGPATVRGSAS
jgi:hypothetical protein